MKPQRLATIGLSSFIITPTGSHIILQKRKNNTTQEEKPKKIKNGVFLSSVPSLGDINNLAFISENFSI